MLIDAYANVTYFFLHALLKTLTMHEENVVTDYNVVPDVLADLKTKPSKVPQANDEEDGSDM
jgi:hypothetical protein